MTFTATPATVLRNRNHRLAQEAKTPVYTSETKPREHISAVEVESDGHRSWEHMPDSEVAVYLCSLPLSYVLSDVDHSAKCWCQK